MLGTSKRKTLSLFSIPLSIPNTKLQNINQALVSSTLVEGAKLSVYLTDSGYVRKITYALDVGAETKAAKPLGTLLAILYNGSLDDELDVFADEIEEFFDYSDISDELQSSGETSRSLTYNNAKVIMKISVQDYSITTTLTPLSKYLNDDSSSSNTSGTEVIDVSGNNDTSSSTPKPTATSTPKATATPKPTATPSPSPTPTPTVTTDDQVGEVYITQTGKKFHRSSCATIKNSTGLQKISREEALARGYTACKVCNP